MDNLYFRSASFGGGGGRGGGYANNNNGGCQFNAPITTIPEELLKEARFQPAYFQQDDLHFEEVEKIMLNAAAGDAGTGDAGRHSYDNFNHKLSQGILDAPKLDLHQVPPTIFDNKPPLTIIYLRDNSISHLPEFFFDELPSVGWLDVRNNKLTSLPALTLEHGALRVLLVQDNRLRTLPYSLALASSLRTIGLSGNPVTTPPESVIAGGCATVLGWLKKRMVLRVPINEVGEAETILPVGSDSEDQQLAADLKKTASKRGRVYYVDPKGSASQTEAKKKVDRLKYTWDLWKRLPYEGQSRAKIFEKSLEGAKSEVLSKFNQQQALILQKLKDKDVLRKWQNETRLMAIKKGRGGGSESNYCSSSSAPFGNDYNNKGGEEVPKSSPTMTLNVEQFRVEVEGCWNKLREFRANPAPISDTTQALIRLGEVEEIQRKLMDMKLLVIKKKADPSFNKHQPAEPSL